VISTGYYATVSGWFSPDRTRFVLSPVPTRYLFRNRFCDADTTLIRLDCSFTKIINIRTSQIGLDPFSILRELSKLLLSESGQCI